MPPPLEKCPTTGSKPTVDVGMPGLRAATVGNVLDYAPQTHAGRGGPAPGAGGPGPNTPTVGKVPDYEP